MRFPGPAACAALLTLTAAPDGAAQSRGDSSAAPPGAVAYAATRAALDSLFGDPRFANTSWGALVVDAVSGDTVYTRNAARLFVPGSNQKLVTAAVALATLGPDYRFVTRLASDAPIRGGTLEGDLVVIGTGDPSFSDHMRDGDGMAPLRDMADSLRALGVLRIDGAVRRGPAAFTDSPIGFGWAWDDLGAAYGATVGELMFNEAFTPVRVTLDGEVDTTTARKRPAHQHFLDAFYDALRSRGISVRAGFDWTTRAADSGLATLATFESPPLRDIIEHLQKESQNQIAEVVLKTLGRVHGGAGRADSGAAVVGRALRAWGADSTTFIVRDGSGLSRHDWITPQTLVRVLLAARADTAFAVFRDALPLAGVDGTLERRMRGTRAAGNARAKTGSMDRVRALAGYVTTAGGRELAFSMVINGYTLAGSDVEAVMDSAVARLADARAR